MSVQLNVELKVLCLVVHYMLLCLDHAVLSAVSVRPSVCPVLSKVPCEGRMRKQIEQQTLKAKHQLSHGLVGSERFWPYTAASRPNPSSASNTTYQHCITAVYVSANYNLPWLALPQEAALLSRSAKGTSNYWSLRTEFSPKLAGVLQAVVQQTATNFDFTD